jgi:hypothetical protein
VSTQTGFLKVCVGENHGACGVEGNWWGEHEGNNHLEDNIIMELLEMEWNRVDWIHLAQVTDK